jgi:hypothetical protein
MPLYFGRFARMRCSSESNCSLLKRYRPRNSRGVMFFSKSVHVILTGRRLVRRIPCCIKTATATARTTAITRCRRRRAVRARWARRSRSPVSLTIVRV